MNRVFKIGDFPFRLLYPDSITPPDNFLLFESDEQPEYTYQLELTDNLPQPNGPILACRPNLLIYQAPEGEGRLITSAGLSEPFASYQEVAPRQARISLIPSAQPILQLDPGFLSPLVMERRMIEKDSLILHCAYIEHQGKAILFSAPSETGKSTQAGLWERYRGSRTINGDRGLLRKINGTWTACGWPVCGSSGQCSLGDTPIHAIVMLKQGPENQTVRLSPLQAFSQIYSQITINQWNKDFVRRAMALLEDLITQVPIYQLTCNISEDAVRCLEAALFPGTE